MIYHAAEPMLVTLFGEGPLPSPGILDGEYDDDLLGLELELEGMSGDDLRLIRMMATMSPAERQYVLAARPELMGFWAKLVKGVARVGKKFGKRIGSRIAARIRARRKSGKGGAVAKAFRRLGKRIRKRIKARRARRRGKRKGRSVKSVAAVVARNEGAQSAAAQQLVAQQTAARAAVVQAQRARTGNMLMVTGVGIAALTLLTLGKRKRG